MKIRHLWLALAGMLAGCSGLSNPLAPTARDAQIQFLSGHGSDDAVLWDFYCNGGRRANVWTQIHVPSCWEQEGFGEYNYGYDLRTRRVPADQVAHEQGFYRHDFTVPAEWKDKTVRIVFEGVMTDADVKINGQSAGPTHQGAFYEFKYDITPLLKFGETNRLEVWVSKESANASVNNAERRGDYWNFGGIFRPVFLEAEPRQFIDWTGINAQADGSFSAQIHLGAAAAAPETVAAQVYDAQNHPVGAAFSAEVAAGTDTATVRANFPGVKLWNAETPNLYRVRFTLLSGGEVAAADTERFGFRTIEIRPGGGFYLNGTKVVLKGICRHSFWPETGRTLDKQICYDDAKMIKDMNMNAVRMSHYPPDRDFLEACDELGLYVLDELSGWQTAYDTPTGAKLIGEMVRRDVNHPSILFWDNGNEGGWNTANDGEFAKWDPQARQVFHPRSTDHGVNDPHYPSYAQVVAGVNGPQVYFPTEFLHGIYDGGLGAGFHDYWNAMKNGTDFGGAIFWAFLDEGVARTDEGGKIDNFGSYAPDGIVGPHREKEGSYFTVKQIWSPVQVSEFAATGGNATVKVENSYDFTNLNQCSFTWEAARLPGPADGHAGHEVLASGKIRGPDVAPHGSATISLPSGRDVPGADVLYLTAKDPTGHALWTWSYALPALAPAATAPAPSSDKTSLREEARQWVATAGTLELRFSKDTGMLAGVTQAGKTISLANGPRFVAAHRLPAGSLPTKYEDLSGPSTLTGLTTRTTGGDVFVEAKYQGALKSATWRIAANGQVRLDYTYAYDGVVDLLGVNFDYPEANMKGVTWEGWGPYHTWQNRAEGATLDVWKNAYNDSIPSVTYFYPEFKGYFRGWRWTVFDTAEGAIRLENAGDPDSSFLGVYTPAEGPVGPLLDLPQTGLAFLDVIPANRDKGKPQDQLGPQSAAQTVSGEHHGSVVFEFPAP
jgi:hypothetical protein